VTARRAPVLLAIGVVACLCAARPAPAGPDEPAQARARAETRASRAPRDTATVQFVTSEGPLTLRLRGDALTATLNGKPLGADRLRAEPDAWSVLDEAGEPWIRIDRRALVGARGRAVRTDAPRRLALGVVTNPIRGALAAQLGLAPGSALVVESLVGGGPAERAGLARYDVIDAVNGETPVTIARLRSAIESAAGGEPIRLHVIRRAEPSVIEVTPEPEPAGAFVFSTLAPGVVSVPDTDGLFAAGPRLSREVEDRLRDEAVRAWVASDALETTKRRLEKLTQARWLDEDRRAEIERAMRAAEASLRSAEITFDVEIGLPEVQFVESAGRDVALFPRGGLPDAASFAPRGGVRPLGGRPDADALTDRLARVEARLERLEALLSRLVERETHPRESPPRVPDT